MPEESILPVKNTFVHFEKTDPQLPRSQSAPAIITTQPNPEELKTIKQTVTIPCYAAPLEEPQKKLYQDENTEILAE